MGFVMPPQKCVHGFFHKTCCIRCYTGKFDFDALWQFYTGVSDCSVRNASTFRSKCRSFSAEAIHQIQTNRNGISITPLARVLQHPAHGIFQCERSCHQATRRPRYMPILPRSKYVLT